MSRQVRQQDVKRARTSTNPKEQDPSLHANVRMLLESPIPSVPALSMNLGMGKLVNTLVISEIVAHCFVRSNAIRHSQIRIDTQEIVLVRVCLEFFDHL